jgi:hypothetical protein
MEVLIITSVACELILISQIIGNVIIVIFLVKVKNMLSLLLKV